MKAKDTHQDNRLRLGDADLSWVVEDLDCHCSLAVSFLLLSHSCSSEQSQCGRVQVLSQSEGGLRAKIRSRSSSY